MTASPATRRTTFPPPLRGRDGNCRNGIRRPGYVLVAVLLVVVVLSLAAYRFLDSMSSQALVAQRATEQAQARSYAVSGVHHFMALASDPATYYGSLGGNPTDMSTSPFSISPRPFSIMC